MPRCEKDNSLMQTTLPIHSLWEKKLNCYKGIFIWYHPGPDLYCTASCERNLLFCIKFVLILNIHLQESVPQSLKDRILKEVDINNDGVIDYDEFLLLGRLLPSGHSKLLVSLYHLYSTGAEFFSFIQHRQTTRET
jgi:hypothetical protein